MSQKLPITEYNKAELFNKIDELPPDGSYYVEIKKFKKQRTGLQNNSLHLYCSQMAKLMNDAEISANAMIKSFRHGFEIPVTAVMIKDIFRRVGFEMFQKESTSDLLTTECQEVYEAVNRGFAETQGISLPWPSKESLMWKDR